MDKSTFIHRRNFLAVLGGISASVFAKILPDRLGTPSDIARENVESASNVNPSIRCVGLAYRKQQGRMESLESLIVALDGIADGKDVLRWAQSGADGAKESIRKRIRVDFALGRTINCEGWILSVTEARLCAVALLIV
jgi:hypothetical protein